LSSRAHGNIERRRGEVNVTGCPSEAELLDAIEGRLGDADASAVTAHLDACELCRALIECVADAGAQGTDPLIGTVLGEYVVEERIGQGGMGIVYRARHPLIGKQVAVKLLRGRLSRDEASMKGLLAEAQAVNAIGHRGIIDIFSIGQLPDGRRYIVMEYLVGAPLNEYLAATGKLTPYQMLLLLDDVLAALGAAHAAGIIHRDLKPSNLFLVAQPDGTKFVKVLDFGLARPMGKRDARTQELLLGTPEYMAPELIHGGELGAWTDLYAVGVIAWQMLAGRRLFGDASVTQILRKHLDAPVPPLSLYAPGVPPPIEKWVSSLLQKDARKRPRDTVEVRQKLKRMLHALSTERTVPAEAVTVAAVPVVSDPIETIGMRLKHPKDALVEPNTDPDRSAMEGPVPDSLTETRSSTHESAIVTAPMRTTPGWRRALGAFVDWVARLIPRGKAAP